MKSWFFEKRQTFSQIHKEKEIENQIDTMKG